MKKYITIGMLMLNSCYIPPGTIDCAFPKSLTKESATATSEGCRFYMEKNPVCNPSNIEFLDKDCDRKFEYAFKLRNDHSGPKVLQRNQRTEELFLEAEKHYATYLKHKEERERKLREEKKMLDNLERFFQ